MGRAESLHRHLNRRTFIATLRTWLYVQRTIGALRPHFLSHLLRVSILRWSHKGALQRAHLPLPKYSTAGFMLRKDFKTNWESNWKSWWSINNLSQSIRYDSRLYTLNLCRSAARVLPLRQASSQMNNEQTLEDRDLMQKSLSPCHAAALKDSPPLPRFVKFFYLPFFFFPSRSVTLVSRR